MSPRKGPRRTQLAVRVSDTGIQAIDALAIKAGLVKADGEPNRSEMTRRLLAAAITDKRITTAVVTPRH